MYSVQKDLNFTLSLSHVISGLSFWYSLRCASMKLCLPQNQLLTVMKSWTSRILDLSSCYNFDKFVVWMLSQFFFKSILLAVNSVGLDHGYFFFFFLGGWFVLQMSWMSKFVSISLSVVTSLPWCGRPAILSVCSKAALKSLAVHKDLFKESVSVSCISFWSCCKKFTLSVVMLDA